MYYEVKGKIKGKDGEYGRRMVVMHNRSTGELISKTYSNSLTGDYVLKTATHEPVSITVYPEDGETTNAKIFDFVTPSKVIYDGVGIGVAGEPGFGVGVAPVTPPGFVPMDGFLDKFHENYGNYQYTDGSVMVWIPAFYYKWGTGENGVPLNSVDIKDKSLYASTALANADGYAFHRAFIDGGMEKTGVFVDKYLNSHNAESNCTSSKRYGVVLSGVTRYGTPTFSIFPGVNNLVHSAIDIAKKRGEGFFCNSRFIFAALSLLAHAHGKSSTSADYCAWFGVNNFPKGANESNRDFNDKKQHFYVKKFPTLRLQVEQMN